jgi:hypothetical protein
MVKYEVLSKIFRHCVENDTKFFRSSVAYELHDISAGNIGYSLKELRKQKYIELIGYNDYELTVFSQMMLYIGRVIRRYFSIANTEIRIEILKCLEGNGIRGDFMDFILTNDLTPEEFAKFLDLSIQEVNYLLDYIDINLCRTAIKRRIQLPFSTLLLDE